MKTWKLFSLLSMSIINVSPLLSLPLQPLKALRASRAFISPSSTVYSPALTVRMESAQYALRSEFKLFFPGFYT